MKDRALRNAVLRAARNLRDVSRNCLIEDPAALKAWEALDCALNDRDDFIASSLPGAADNEAPVVAERAVFMCRQCNRPLATKAEHAHAKACACGSCMGEACFGVDTAGCSAEWRARKKE